MNNSVYGKTMENVRKHRDVKLVTTDSERKKLVSKPNYHTCKQFPEDLMAIEMKKTKIHMNKPVYVGQAVLHISKTLMYEFWYDYIIPKYFDNAKLCYMNTDSFIFTIKTDDFYEDIMSDLEKWYDTSKIDQKLNRCIPIGINEGVIGMFKDELNGNVMIDFVSLASKLYAFIDDKDKCEKKAKDVKKCVIKKVLKLNHYKQTLSSNKTIRTTQQRFKNDYHNITTEELNKIALSRKDDKRIH